jgi:hypothetical protein
MSTIDRRGDADDHDDNTEAAARALREALLLRPAAERGQALAEHVAGLLGQVLTFRPAPDLTDDPMSTIDRREELLSEVKRAQAAFVEGSPDDLPILRRAYLEARHAHVREGGRDRAGECALDLLARLLVDELDRKDNERDLRREPNQATAVATYQDLLRLEAGIP